MNGNPRGSNALHPLTDLPSRHAIEDMTCTALKDISSLNQLRQKRLCWHNRRFVQREDILVYVVAIHGNLKYMF